MKTRTEKEILNLINDFSKSDDTIRVTLLNGSRANPNAVKDPFQDYDIANFVLDVNPFRNEEYVLAHFDEALVVEQPLSGPWPPDDADGTYHNYNMQFIDGNRIDLSFYPLSVLDKKIKDSLTKVLIDKDTRISSISPPNEGSYYLNKPDETIYKGCCTGFFFTLSAYIPKTIWRKQLPLLKFYIESCLRNSMIMMFEWEIGTRTGWDKSIGLKGKYLEEYMIADTWKEYRKTFVGSDYTDIWESLFLSYTIFTTTARSVAENLRFTFPEKQAIQTLKYLEHVRELPADAEVIYCS